MTQSDKERFTKYAIQAANLANKQKNKNIERALITLANTFWTLSTNYKRAGADWKSFELSFNALLDRLTKE